MPDTTPMRTTPRRSWSRTARAAGSARWPVRSHITQQRRDIGRQPDREAREDDVERDREGELEAREQDGIEVHRMAPRSRSLVNDIGAAIDPLVTAPQRLAQRLLDREKIAPGEALLQRRAQQIGRMEGRDGADLARAGMEVEPAPARALDAFLDAEQRLRRRAAEADQHVRIGELDLALDERQADLALLRRRRAVAGRAPRNDVGDVGAAAVEPDRRHHQVEQLAGAPDEGQAFEVLLASRRLADEHHAAPADCRPRTPAAWRSCAARSLRTSAGCRAAHPGSRRCARPRAPPSRRLRARPARPAAIAGAARGGMRSGAAPSDARAPARRARSRAAPPTAGRPALRRAARRRPPRRRRRAIRAPRGCVQGSLTCRSTEAVHTLLA